MTLAAIGSDRDSRRWWVLAVVVAAQFMVILDIAIVNVALPSIKTDLHFSQENLQWVITAYAILFGGALLLGGRLADLLGRRRMFMVGLAVFSVSSLLSGVASITSGLMLLVYALTRATQNGWTTGGTLALFAASAALVVGFVVIELRAAAPLLPMRIFRLRTLSAANATAVVIASVAFSEF